MTEIYLPEQLVSVAKHRTLLRAAKEYITRPFRTVTRQSFFTTILHFFGIVRIYHMTLRVYNGS